MITFPILITLFAGFSHAFETDHLIAVSNIVTRRSAINLSLKDGAFWGLGHTSTILLMGVLMLVLKMNITPEQFKYFEASVGIMLIILGLVRLWKHYHGGMAHSHSNKSDGKHSHSLAYSVGLVHGLAGSGVLMVLVMSQMQAVEEGLLYIFVFGLGSIAGMTMAAGLFSIPFSKKMLDWNRLQLLLTISSCILCIMFGARVVIENLG